MSLWKWSISLSMFLKSVTDFADTLIPYDCGQVYYMDCIQSRLG